MRPTDQDPKQLSWFMRRVVDGMRLLPPGTPGKTRLASRVLRLPAGVHSVRLNDGTELLVPSLDEPVAFFALIDGAYEPMTLRVLQEIMSKGGTFVDVGANVGAISLPMGRWLGLQGRVVAIEGQPQIAELLRSSISRNDSSNVELHALLCGETNGTVQFYDAPSSHFGMGSRGAQFGSAPVLRPVMRLDDLVASAERVAAMKVDVEGFELQVFQGAHRILTRDRPAVVFEFCDWAEARNASARVGDSQRFLMDLGYDVLPLARFPDRQARLARPLDQGSAMLIALPG
jgi:FkbM family methyltransferase